MDNRYLSRVYFSRYFYSSFKCTLKTRIKITRVENFYFYSDPYYLNKRLKQFKNQDQDLPITVAPIRSFFIPLYFRFAPFGNFYDLGWKSFPTNSDFRVKFFSIFFKLKFTNFFHPNFTKIYFNFFSRFLK